jgi:hypothetical protein
MMIAVIRGVFNFVFPRIMRQGWNSTCAIEFQAVWAAESPPCATSGQEVSYIILRVNSKKGRKI